jgi:hypothetical protein
MRAARSPDRTQTTAGAILIGAPIAPAQHRRGANQTRPQTERDRFGDLVDIVANSRMSQNALSPPLRTCPTTPDRRHAADDANVA